MQWEYRVERIDSTGERTGGDAAEFEQLRDHLNLLGSEEWELVGHHAMPGPSGSSHLMFMKRPAREIVAATPEPVAAFAGGVGWHYNVALDKWFCDVHGRVTCTECLATAADPA